MIFLAKILLTGFTLGAGFKEVKSPLFFIGATLGSALSLIVPPNCLLAGMGFVAVFSGATHTPIACTIMGMELWDAKWSIYQVPVSLAIWHQDL
jgi:H+/Cl- antiporter ClcA